MNTSINQTMQQTQQIPPQLMNEITIYKTLFEDLLNNDKWGYGAKRITLSLKNSITEKIPFSGYGYKEQNNILYVGVRMWWDQGDYTKLKQYDKNYTIMSHFMSLLNEFN